MVIAPRISEREKSVRGAKWLAIPLITSKSGCSSTVKRIEDESIADVKFLRVNNGLVRRHGVTCSRSKGELAISDERKSALVLNISMSKPSG